MCSSDEPFYLGIRRVYKDRDAKVDHDKARAIVRTTRDEKVCFSASDLDAPPDLRGDGDCFRELVHEVEGDGRRGKFRTVKGRCDGTGR